MAFNDSKTTNNGPANAAMSQAMGAARAAGAQQSNGGFSFNSFKSLSTPAMSRTIAAETLTRMTKYFQEQIDAGVNQQYTIGLVPMDQADTGLPISMLIVTLKDNVNETNVVAYHKLLLEASAEPFSPMISTAYEAGRNGSTSVPVEIIRTLADFDTDEVDAIVVTHLSKMIGANVVLNCGSCIVPRIFNLEDKRMRNDLLVNACFAASSRLEQQRPNYQRFNLADAKDDSRLTVRITFGNSDVLDAAGKPIRSDIIITLISAPFKNPQQNSIMALAQRDVTIITVRGYLDLEWNPVHDTTVNNFAIPVQRSDYTTYVPRMVLTSMTSEGPVTPETQLLALRVVVSVFERNAWITAFRPGLSNGFNISKDINVRDIGAINLEVNLLDDPSGIGQHMTYTDDDLYTIISRAFHPQLIISLDVEESGPAGWNLKLIADAAAGNPDAERELIRACDALTNGNFSKYWHETDKIAFTENNIIQLGYTNAADGTLIDARHIDYLLTLNKNTSRLDVSRELSNTYSETNTSLELRLQKRRNIAASMFTNITYCGTATRVLFSGKFIAALVNATNACGFKYNVDCPQYAAAPNKRAVSPYLQDAMLPTELSIGTNRQTFQGGQTTSYYSTRGQRTW